MFASTIIEWKCSLKDKNTMQIVFEQLDVELKMSNQPTHM